MDVYEEILSGADVGGSGTLNEVKYFSRLWCPEGQYSTNGQLFFVPLAEALRLILHLGETVECGDSVDSRCGTNLFPLSSIVPFFLLTFMLMIWTYGVGAATGLFVPSLSVGATLGNLIGRLMQALVARSTFADTVTIDLRAYAALGAAASLGTLY